MQPIHTTILYARPMFRIVMGGDIQSPPWTKDDDGHAAQVRESKQLEEKHRGSAVSGFIDSVI